MPKGDRFVDVPEKTMIDFLESKGFVRGQAGNELVFDKKHERDEFMTIRVFTSISLTAGTRGLGKDAIRVVAFYESPFEKRGIAKTQRVFRTGSVEKILARLLERMREAYAVANKFVAMRRRAAWERSRRAAS